MIHHTLTTYQILSAFCAVPLGLMLALCVGVAALRAGREKDSGWYSLDDTESLRTVSAKFRRRNGGNR